MDRGKATFEVMKGFEDLTTKCFDGGPDTLPGKMKGDVTDSADIDHAGKTKSGANAKRSDNTPGGPGITMRPDAKDIEDKADGDIDSGYVSDVQTLKNRGKRNKGYEGFNDLVSKGVVVDTSFDKFDVDNSMAMIEKEADFQLSMATDTPSSWMVEKAPEDDMIVAKGMSFAEFEEKGVREVGRAVKDAVKEGASWTGKKAKAGYKATKAHIGAHKHAYGYGATGAGALGVGYAAGSRNKGFENYNSGMATKGFTIEEKGVREVGRAVKDAVKEGASWTNKKARAAVKAGKAHVGRHKVAYGVGAGAAGGLGVGYGVGSGKFDRKETDTSMLVTKSKGNKEAYEALEKPIRFGLRRAKDKVVGKLRGGYEATKAHVKRHPHAYGYGATGAGAVGAGYGAAKYQESRKGFGLEEKGIREVGRAVKDAVKEGASWTGKKAKAGYGATKAHIKRHPHAYGYGATAAGGLGVGYGATKLRKKD